MAQSISTSALRANVALSYARSIASQNNTFITIGNKTGAAIAETAVDSAADISEFHSRMIGGIKVTNQDVSVSTDRVNWVAGNVYDQYNAYQDTSCFITVASGTSFNVYKCLSNNNGAPSTAIPNLVSAPPFKTADNYVWQFMWTVSDVIASKFSTPTTIPVVTATALSSQAVKGSVDTFVINDAGRLYNNYFNGIIQTTDIQTSTSIRLPATASAVNGFYENCTLEVTSAGSVNYGEVRIITAYNGATKSITLSAPFSGLQVNDTYAIRPQVIVTGSANSAIVSAVVDPGANTIASVIVHARGSDYTLATANVYANSAVGVLRQADITPHPSPIQGHGGNILVDADARYVTIAKTIANTTPFIANVSSFAAIGIVSDYLLNNVVVTGSGRIGAFIPSETVLAYRKVGGDLGPVVATANSITSAQSTFAGIRVNDIVAIANSSVVSLATVQSIANSSYATVTNQFAISGNASVIHTAQLGTVQTVNSTSVTLTNVPTNIPSTYTNIVGATSKATGTVTNIGYSPDQNTATANSVVKNSGTVVYINNSAPINIASNKSITVKLTITF